MSLFRGENPILSRIRMDQTGAPAVAGEGDIWNDATLKAMQAKLNGIQGSLCLIDSVNITPVTATNPSTAQNLMSFSVPAGGINVVNKGLYIAGAGLYTTAAAQTPTLNIAVTLGGVTVLSWTSGATTAASTNFPWNFDAYLIAASTGATGTLESHGIANITLGAAASGAETSYNDTNTAVSGAINLTTAQTLQVTCTLSTANAGNSVSQRLFYVQSVN